MSIVSHLINDIRHSLSTKLSLSILVLAIPIFVVSVGILFLQSRHIVRKEAIERSSSVLSASMQRLTRYMNVVETATDITAWLIEENAKPDSFLSYSRRVVSLNPNIDGCSISAEPYLFPEYGRYFSAYTIRENDSIITVKEEDYEYFDEIWYKRPIELGKPCWVSYYDQSDKLAVTLDGILISYCRVLNNKQGKQLGIISTDIALRQLSKTITAEKPYPNSYFIMLGKDGSYYVHPDTTKLFTHTIYEDAKVEGKDGIVDLGERMTSGKSGSMRVKIDGQDCIVCYQSVKNTEWSLALICPEYDILKGYYHLAYLITPLIIIGLLLILLMCHIVVSHAIKPVRQLLEQSLRMAEGDYNVQISHSHRIDAVGRLQNSFAAMQKSLKQHINNIQKVNEETVQRNEELQKASQLAEEAARQKTAFIQNMTHQIRTPLNIMLGFAQVLRDNFGQMAEEEVQNITDMMNHNAMSLYRMVMMLYDSSDAAKSEEKGQIDFVDVSCNEVAQEAIFHTNIHFPDLPINFNTTVSDDFCIKTSRIHLMRSLREILYNSAKYSDRKNISLLIMHTDKDVSFIFEDTGKGIPEEYRDQMFKPFTKSDDLSEGLGLGLALAKRHVENLGGEFTLDASYHEGCRFIITLPRKPKP